MGLKLPDLADKDFEELLEEARKLLPVHSEEWTDHNVHDPGITILEMLAWLGETYIYQLDRVTDEHVRKYLKLMGASPRPPRPASVPLKVVPPANSAGVRLPAGEPLRVRSDSGSELSFETVSSIVLNEARIDRVISEHRRGRTDNSNANETSGLDFFAFGEAAEQGSALYLGFRHRYEGSDGENPRDPFEGVELLDLDVSYYDADLPKPGSHGREPSTFKPTVEVSWQYLTDYTEWYRDSAWMELRVERDETNQFYRSGRVTLAIPDNRIRPDRNVRVLNQEGMFYWIRCVVTTSGYEIPPRFRSVDLNVVEARHQRIVQDEQLRRADGSDKTTAHPDQVFEFAHSPVLDATYSQTDHLESNIEDPRIVLRQDDGTVSDPSTWTRVPDFDASDPDDEHYILDHASGTLRFGNGIRGKVPEAGQTVIAESYVYGGGVEGNVPQTSEWTFEDDGTLGEGMITIQSREAATGGYDAETVDAALARLKRDLKTPYRAVTADDYRELAMNTPGLRFGRARAIVESVGTEKQSERYNRVRVVVVPSGTGSPSERPTPSEGFLQAVQHHLETHRLITDRVTVEAPMYVGVGITADVRIKPGYVRDSVRAEVKTALKKFLDPLSGFEGNGWPFGRPVYRSEIYEVIEAQRGIEGVLKMALTARDGGRLDSDGNVSLGPSTLPYAIGRQVTVSTSQRRSGGGI